MKQSKMKLNDDIKSNRTTFPNAQPTSLRIGSAGCPFTTSARNFGFMISNNMSFDKHISNVCRSAYVEIRRISSIRQYLTVQATKTLVCAFVLAKLDYCTSLLHGCPLYILKRLQKVKDFAAKLVFKSRRRDHVQPLLQALRWLSVQAKIDYKLSAICHIHRPPPPPPSFLQNFIKDSPLQTIPQQLISNSVFFLS